MNSEPQQHAARTPSRSLRPDLLFPLFAPTTSLTGVGPKVAKLIERVAGPHVLDLCWHLPTAMIDRQIVDDRAAVEVGRTATLRVTVHQHEPGDKRRPWRVNCTSPAGPVSLIFFHARRDWIQGQLPIGHERLVSGRIEAYRGIFQIAHPDYIVRPERADDLPLREPVYPMTVGLSGKQISKAVRSALSRAPDLPEWLDPVLMRQQRWPAWKDALQSVHAPQTAEDLDPLTPARARLAYDELLANQLALTLVRLRERQDKGVPIPSESELRHSMEAALPFSLTNGQQEALREIGGDMSGGRKMLRLLQGDVGSGKTVVAALAMADIVATGRQAALMAPTELLARQHHATLSALLEPAGVPCGFLSGREKGRARREILEALADGSLPIIVGTHALFQDDVTFHDLALVTVDEQHRFGVEQRMRLSAKGHQPHVLVMTATPIPRTLTLTAYGDLDVSRLREKPPGRQEIDTRTVSAERLEDVVAGVGRAIEGGARAYWICPLVEESDQVSAAAAEARFAELKPIFGSRVGLLHGRMKGAEKDAAMAAFVSGETSLLVATTVVEVGVDVPEATVMVVEQAERFGLAQLHQLRGRIGRGDRPSTCILLYTPPLGQMARARLETMRNTNDGFVIAEEDLRLRGSGELLGTRQSGLPSFRLADLEAHGELLHMAASDARLAAERDPGLKTPRGEALRVLLYLFERDSAARYFRSA